MAACNWSEGNEEDRVVGVRETVDDEGVGSALRSGRALEGNERSISTTEPSKSEAGK